MQTKKIIGIALAASLVSSMVAITASAAAMTSNEDFANIESLGIVGSLTGWGEQPDIAMDDADGDGIYIGVVRDLAAGEYQFKVRADSNWDNSWGVYEEEYDRTFNSQTNCSVSVTEKTDLIVALDTNGDDFNLWPVTFLSTEASQPSKYGAVGSMTGWGNDDPDAPLYELLPNLFVGTLHDVPAGEQQFKVRANGTWDESYGVYELDYDRTNNSQTNCTETLEDTADIVVMLDTRGEDDQIWPVSYLVYNADGTTKGVYTGKEKEEEESQESQESQESEESQESQESEESQVSDLDGYDTQVTDYIYFDNSETQWDEVWAYWWHPDYARTWDLTGADHGCVVVVNEETGEEGYEPTAFPGTKMEQVLDENGEPTDIWQIRVPFNAQKIIFGSGKSDAQIQEGETGYQTADLDFNAEENAGQIYTIDTSVEAVPGRGIEKTKYKYNAGAWTNYDGLFNSEHFGEIPSTPEEDSQASEEVSDASEESTESTTSEVSTVSEASKTTSTTTTTTTTTTTSTVDAPKTGDVAMAAGFIAILAAALGAVVLAVKKKRV